MNIGESICFQIDLGSGREATAAITKTPLNCIARVVSNSELTEEDNRVIAEVFAVVLQRLGFTISGIARAQCSSFEDMQAKAHQLVYGGSAN